MAPPHKKRKVSNCLHHHILRQGAVINRNMRADLKMKVRELQTEVQNKLQGVIFQQDLLCTYSKYKESLELFMRAIQFALLDVVNLHRISTTAIGVDSADMKIAPYKRKRMALECETKHEKLQNKLSEIQIHKESLENMMYNVHKYNMLCTFSNYWINVHLPLDVEIYQKKQFQVLESFDYRLRAASKCIFEDYKIHWLQIAKDFAVHVTKFRLMDPDKRAKFHEKFLTCNREWIRDRLCKQLQTFWEVELRNYIMLHSRIRRNFWTTEHNLREMTEYQHIHSLRHLLGHVNNFKLHVTDLCMMRYKASI